MKYTQGEWYAKEGQIYPIETGNTLALIPYYDGTEEQEANAKLIAASKDLLENLIRIIDRIEENGYHTTFTSAYERAKSAINKATL